MLTSFAPFDLPDDPAISSFANLRVSLVNDAFRLDYLRPGPPFRYQHYYYIHTCPLLSTPELSSKLIDEILPLFSWPLRGEEEAYSGRRPTLLIGCLPECWEMDIRRFIVAREPRLKIDFAFPCLRFERWFSENPLDEAELTLPPIVGELGLVCDCLHQSDVSFVQPFHSVDLPDDYVSMIISVCPTVCIREPETKEPVAWIIQYPNDGSVGFLEVVPRLRRRGLAIAVVNLLVAKVKERQPDLPFVHAYAFESNVASRRLFGEKLGWKFGDGKFFWIQCSLEEEGVDS